MALSRTASRCDCAVAASLIFVIADAEECWSLDQILGLAAFKQGGLRCEHESVARAGFFRAPAAATPTLASGALAR